MNDKIKEILDYLQENSKKDEATKQLVDYITNLQKENEILKDAQNNLEKQFIKEMNYKTRCDKAINKLKEIKFDLDFEPWSFYDTEGKILFDLVNILEGKE